LCAWHLWRRLRRLPALDEPARQSG
jgi:hypothetical protein